MSLVRVFWTSTPLSEQLMAMSSGSSKSSRVTNAGPIGAKPE
jgi:hypothetical protein